MTWGILLGLCLGKPVGILGASWLAVKSGYAQLPSKVHWQHFIGIALLGGIGFTMSLFIGTLAFPDATTALTPLIRTGVMAGSLLSGFIGYLFLRFSYQSK
jgi:NhaA family Na+:H+ antiporter